MIPKLMESLAKTSNAYRSASRFSRSSSSCASRLFAPRGSAETTGVACACRAPSATRVGMSVVPPVERHSRSVLESCGKVGEHVATEVVAGRLFGGEFEHPGRDLRRGESHRRQAAVAGGGDARAVHDVVAVRVQRLELDDLAVRAVVGLEDDLHMAGRNDVVDDGEEDPVLPRGPWPWKVLPPNDRLVACLAELLDRKVEDPAQTACQDARRDIHSGLDVAPQ